MLIWSAMMSIKVCHNARPHPQAARCMPNYLKIINNQMNKIYDGDYGHMGE